MQRIAPSDKPVVTARDHQDWRDASLAFRPSLASLEDLMVGDRDHVVPDR